jgi:hypothetical protein
MMRGLIVGINCANAILQKETPQYLLVVRLSAAMGKACSKLSKNDKRKNDSFGLFKEFYSFWNAPTKVDVAVRVESDSHFHISLSTTSWLANAASTVFSALHVPAISLRLRRRDRTAVKPEPAVRASTAASFRLFPDARARSLSASSKAGGIPRIVYCMHSL